MRVSFKSSYLDSTCNINKKSKNNEQKERLKAPTKLPIISKFKEWMNNHF